MGIFGWSYPAGCESVPDDEPCYCDVCGQLDDECVCPECPLCGEVGDRECYDDLNNEKRHGLEVSDRQRDAIQDSIARDEAEAFEPDACPWCGRCDAGAHYEGCPEHQE